MAPMAPLGGGIEKHGFVFSLGASEGGIAPFVRGNRLVRRGTQVGAGGIFQAVFRMVGQSRSQFEVAKEEQLRSFPAGLESSRQGRDGSIALLRVTCARIRAPGCNRCNKKRA